MKTLLLQNKILSFARRDGVSEPSSELAKLAETTGVSLPTGQLDGPAELVALKIALAAGEKVEEAIDLLASQRPSQG